MRHVKWLVLLFIFSAMITPRSVYSHNISELITNHSSSAYANRTVIASFIASMQGVDGGFAESGQPPYLNYTALSLLALKYLNMETKADVPAAIDFIVDCQNPDGGFSSMRYYQSSDPSDLYLTWLAVWVLTEYGALNRIDYVAVRDFILSKQLNDGSWGNTFLTAIALLTLKMTGGIGQIDVGKTIKYLTTEPPTGVFYAGIGFLSTPSSSYPDVLSTWAGIVALEALDKGDFVPDKVTEFLESSQIEGSGFAYNPQSDTPSIEATYYAIDLLDRINKLRGDVIDIYGAVTFALTVATIGMDLFSVDLAALTIGTLSDIMIPESFTTNSTTMVVTQGDALSLNISLVNAFLEPITEVDMKVYIEGVNYIATMVEVESGLYTTIIDTSELKNGTYNLTIRGLKSNYQEFEFHRTLSIISYMYVWQLSIYPERNIKVGDTIEVLIELIDRNGDPIKGAKVRVMLGDSAKDLDEKAPGVYSGSIKARVPGNIPLIITAEADGFEDFRYLINLHVAPTVTSENLSEPFMYEVLGLLAIWGLTLVPSSSRRDSLIVFLPVIATFITLKFMNSYIISMAPTPTDPLFSYLSSIEFRLALAGTVGLTAGYLSRRRLFNIRSHYYIVSLYGINIIAFSSFTTHSVTGLLTGIIAITAYFAYLKGGGRPEDHLYKFFSYTSAWLTILTGYAGFAHFVDNPYFFGPAFSPPVAMSFGANALVWVSFGYIVVLVTGFLGIMKYYIEEILTGMRVSVVRDAARLTMRGEI